jgi:hypothetical protein
MRLCCSAYCFCYPHDVGHIRVHHLDDARNATINYQASSRSRKPAELIASYRRARYHLLDPATTTIPTPLATDPPIPELRLHRFYQCTRCECILLHKKSALQQISKHFNRHRLLPRKGGRPLGIADIPEEDEGPIFQEIHCQRFFVSGAQSSFFTVNAPNQAQDLVKSRPKGHVDICYGL